MYTFTPEYCLLDAPFQIQNPRKMYTVLKPVKAPKEKAKKEDKPGKGKQKQKEEKEKVADTQEYINLMKVTAY